MRFLQPKFDDEIEHGGHKSGLVVMECGESGWISSRHSSA